MLITSKKLEMNLQALQTKIQKRSDYGQDICCWYNCQEGPTDRSRLPSIYLYGTKSVLQKIYQEVKRIGDEYTPIPCSVQLTSNQVGICCFIRVNPIERTTYYCLWSVIHI